MAGCGRKLHVWTGIGVLATALTVASCTSGARPAPSRSVPPAPASRRPAPTDTARPQITIDGNGAIAAASGAVWVLKDDVAGNGTEVQRIDPQTLTVAATFRTGRGATTITAGAGAIWVPNGDDHTVTRIDATTNRVSTIRVGGAPWEVGVGQRSVWLVDQHARLTRLEPGTGRPIGKPYDFGRYARFRFQAADCDIVVGSDALWVYETGGISLRIPVNSGVLGVPTKFRPAATMALYRGDLWVSDVEPNALVKVDAKTGAVLATAHRLVQSLVAGSTGVWVTARNVVTKLDPKTGHPISQVTIGSPESNVSLAAGDGRLWAYHITDSTLTRLVP